MARYFDIHPANPQQRAIVQIADIVRAGGVIAYPTDSCYALGCQLGNVDGITRIRSIRHLDDRHHLTLVCRDFAQLGQFVCQGPLGIPVGWPCLLRAGGHQFSRLVAACSPGGRG